jgi:hypothetical protein
MMGSIERFNVKLTQSGDVVQQITLEVFGDLKEIRELMKQPLAIELKPQQLEIGKDA